ncbi:MAG: hypothetical protein ACK55Z_11785, partial [bacterium]
MLLELLQSYAWKPSTLAKPDSEAVSTAITPTRVARALASFLLTVSLGLDLQTSDLLLFSALRRWTSICSQSSCAERCMHCASLLSSSPSTSTETVGSLLAPFSMYS